MKTLIEHDLLTDVVWTAATHNIYIKPEREDELMPLIRQLISHMQSLKSEPET